MRIGRFASGTVLAIDRDCVEPLVPVAAVLSLAGLTPTVSSLRVRARGFADADPVEINVASHIAGRGRSRWRVVTSDLATSSEGIRGATEQRGPWRG